MEIANTIDEKLFADYTRRRAKVIREIVKKGVLEGVDWSTLKQPFSMSNFDFSNDRCATIRPSGASFHCYYPCSNFEHVTCDSVPRYGRTRRVFRC